MKPASLFSFLMAAFFVLSVFGVNLGNAECPPIVLPPPLPVPVRPGPVRPVPPPPPAQLPNSGQLPEEPTTYPAGAETYSCPGAAFKVQTDAFELCAKRDPNLGLFFENSSACIFQQLDPEMVRIIDYKLNDFHSDDFDTRQNTSEELSQFCIHHAHSIIFAGYMTQLWKGLDKLSTKRAIDCKELMYRISVVVMKCS